jgi:hypothetical protein
MTALERHTSAGPARWLHRSAKAAASLVALLSLNEKAEWLTTVLSSPGLPALLSEDMDQAAEITQVWLGNLKAKLTAFAIKID